MTVMNLYGHRGQRLECAGCVVPPLHQFATGRIDGEPDTNFIDGPEALRKSTTE